MIFTKFHELVREIDGGEEIKDISEINRYLKEKTHINHFFRNLEEKSNFFNLLREDAPFGGRANVDLGDYQTPIELTEKVCEILAGEGVKPRVLIEPTCGRGNFVISAIKRFDTLERITCIDVQPRYEWLFKRNMLGLMEEGYSLPEISFKVADYFHFDFSELELGEEKVLILGNPPWVTNSELERLHSINIPVKSNVKGFSGLDSITGKSNFDIAEYIIMDLMKQFSGVHATVAMLCKNIVIRNLVRDASVLGLGISNVRAFTFDAKREFGVNANASLLVADIDSVREDFCTQYSLNRDPNHEVTRFGWYEGKFVSNIDTYRKRKIYDGTCQFEWRQGLKHDLTKIMVLKKDGIKHVNGFKESLRLEADLLYPFLKSSDLKNNCILESSRYHVIVPQQKVGQPTGYIKERYPNLWAYLASHLDLFHKRKSRIYRGKPPFSIFGIGDYSFKPFKVGISGFYKELNFCLILPEKNNHKSIMLDDTCYFLSFDNKKNAVITWLLLNSKENKEFLDSLVFIDSKRPYTKNILVRINLLALLLKTSILERIKEYNKNMEEKMERITREDIEKYKDLLCKNGREKRQIQANLLKFL
ncbi:MAG: methyltransferase [Promethearchaeota archaeon]